MSEETDNTLIRQRAMRGDRKVNIQKNKQLEQNDRDLEEFMKIVNDPDREDNMMVSWLNREAGFRRRE